MPHLQDSLAYIAAAITMAAGVFGFFWARGGERNKVGGIGWVALAFIVAAGLLTVYQTYLKNKSAAAAGVRAEAARAEAARLDEELRQTVLRQSFVIGTQIAGIDLRQVVGGGGLYFEGDHDADHNAIEPPGFVGPFPALGRTGRGAMQLRLDDDVFYTYLLQPTEAGGIRLTPNGQGRASYLIAPTEGLDDFRRIGPPPTRADDPPDGEWSTAPDVGGYNFNFLVAVQFRRLISLLAQQPVYGHLVFTLPEATEAEVERVIASYRTIHPVLVFDASRPGDFVRLDIPCRSFLRIPMEVVHLRTRGRTISFELRASSRGLRVPEVCVEIAD